MLQKPTTLKQPACRLHRETQSVIEPVDDSQRSTSQLPATQTAPLPSSANSDHTYCVTDSPRKLNRKLDDVTSGITWMKRRLKTERQKAFRLRKRVQSLGAVVKSLQQRNLILSSAMEMLEKTFSGVPLAIMKRIVEYRGKMFSRKSYPEQLRTFALTLQFYSTKAYNYVRKHFNLALPHVSTIRRWFQNINGYPGFTAEAFSALQARASCLSCNGEELLCSLMIDEMSVRKHVEWSGTRMLT